MSAPYLLAAIARAALPTHCRWSPSVGYIVAGPRGLTHLLCDRENAKSAYLSLVANLSPADSRAPCAASAEPAAGASATLAVPVAFSSATRLLAVTPGDSSPLPPESPGVPNSGAA